MKHLLDFILENTVIGFKKKTPTYGECIILAGGGGSGKGYIKNIIDADFKTYDVDDLKKKYIKLLNQGKLNDELKDFDFKNPEDVTDLHLRVKEHGWKDKQIDLIFRNKWNPNKEANNSKILPNLLFDRVSGKIEDITEIATRAKTLGYNVTVVWVLCNLEVAKVNNRIRERYIDEKTVLIPAHKDCYKTMTDLFNNKYPHFNDYIDNAWLGYSAGYGRIQGGKYKNSPTIKIKKDNEGKWIFDQENMVDSFLSEKQPLDYERIKKDLRSSNPKTKLQAENFVKIENLDIEKEVA